MVKDCRNKEVVLSTYFVFSLKICKWIVKETDFKIIFIWIRLKRQHLSGKTQSIFLLQPASQDVRIRTTRRATNAACEMTVVDIACGPDRSIGRRGIV